MRVGQHVAHREEHPVAVVVREREHVLVEDPHEAGVASLVRALRPPVGIRSGHEEHVHPFDERPVLGPDRGLLDELLLETVGEPARVVAVLQHPRLAVVHGLHDPILPGTAARLALPLVPSGPDR